LGLLAVALSSSVVFAEARWNLQDWLKELQTRIRRAETRKHSQVVAVAAVRGTKSDGSEARRLYWKGKEKTASVTKEQLDAFKSAVSLAEAGKKDEAEKSLDNFLTTYPESPMKAEAEQTLALLKISQETPAN